MHGRVAVTSIPVKVRASASSPALKASAENPHPSLATTYSALLFPQASPNLAGTAALHLSPSSRTFHSCVRQLFLCLLLHWSLCDNSATVCIPETYRCYAETALKFEGSATSSGVKHGFRPPIRTERNSLPARSDYHPARRDAPTLGSEKSNLRGSVRHSAPLLNCIMGPSGSGNPLLGILAGLDTDSGMVALMGRYYPYGRKQASALHARKSAWFSVLQQFRSLRSKMSKSRCLPAVTAPRAPAPNASNWLG